MSKKDSKKIKQNILNLVKDRKNLQKELDSMDDYKVQLADFKKKNYGDS